MITSISKSLAQQIVDAVYDLCHMPINFISREGIIYAGSDKERIGTFHEIGKRAADSGKTIPVYSDREFQGTRQGINIPIFHHRRVLAVVGITGDPDKASAYANLAGRIAHILIMEQELNETHRTADGKKAYLLQAYMNGEYDSYDYLSACQQEYGLDETGTYRMICIKTVSGQNSSRGTGDFSVSSETEQAVTRIFDSMQEKVFTFLYPNRFVGILKTASFRMNEQRLQNFAEGHPDTVRIAIGKESSLSHMRESWQTVQTALRSMSGSGRNYCCFDDLSLEIILSDVTEKNRIEYLRKTLGTLKPEEISFLRKYYEHDMSLKKTGEELFLHINTVQQKLNRIREKSGLNPRKFREAVLLYLGLQLQEGTESA